MSHPVIVIVRERYQSYQCRHAGRSASSTMDAQTAVERLMDKIWPPGTHRATPTGRGIGPGKTEFVITPIEEATR
jgi:hypothetical protein